METIILAIFLGTIVSFLVYWLLFRIRTDGVLEIHDRGEESKTYKLVLNDLDSIEKKTYFLLKIEKEGRK